jgi:hypothetical protein
MSTADSPDPAPVESARDELQKAIPKAAGTLIDLLEAEDERIQIRAAEAILDRAGVTKAKRVTSTAAERDVGGRGGSSQEFGELGDLVDDLY